MRQEIYKKFAAVLVEKGVNLEPGETLLIRSHPKDYELVQEIAAAAYKMGAKYVKTDYEDEGINRIRAGEAPDTDLEYCPDWLCQYRKSYGEDNCCVICLHSPEIVDTPEAAGRNLLLVQRSEQKSWEGYSEATATGRVSIVKTVVPSISWAAKVYPQLEPGEALDRLWKDFAHICRLDTENPLDSWESHKKEIKKKKELLDREQFQKLYFDSSRTHLEIGLVRGGNWIGGCAVNQKNKREYIPNIPTEEIFFVPHKYQVDGCVVSTVPLNYKGSLIEGISLKVKEGRVVEYSAEKGEDLLASILESDGGSRYFGEVSLVSVLSPIYQTHTVFYDTLLDENATCHMALGKATPGILRDGYTMTAEEREKAGINDSGIHVDFMVGSGELDVDGLSADGERKPIMRKGSWVL